MSKTRYIVEIDIEQLPYCCGATEAGGFELIELEEDSYTYDYDDAYQTKKAAYEHALDDLMKNNSGLNRPMFFNFVKFKGDQSYDHNKLRSLVTNRPDACFVHRWKNPGTGNTIECWMLFNGSKE